MEFSSSSMEFTKYDIDRCLYDVCRTKSLIKAIKNIVKKDDIVVDAGGGSGILGMTAIKFGAKKVYFIETNRRACEVILENAKRNNLTNKIKIIKGDATKVKLPEKADLITCELISGGGFII